MNTFSSSYQILTFTQLEKPVTVSTLPDTPPTSEHVDDTQCVSPELRCIFINKREYLLWYSLDILFQCVY